MPYRLPEQPGCNRMEPVARFAELVDRSAGEVDLGRAALAFAEVADPDADAAAALAELDRLATGVRDFAGLRERLFVTEGFTGAKEDSTDPANSLLHRVLERRRGLPISLSVVVIEVGRRAAVPVEGIGMPGHFLVRDPSSGQYCDPFDGGVLLDEQGCEARFRQATGAGPRVPFGPDALAVVDAHQIIARMLANLANHYRSQADPTGLEWVLRCQRAIPGLRVQATLHLGQALAAQGRFRDAAAELEATAALVDPEQAEQLATAAHSMLARLN